MTALTGTVITPAVVGGLGDEHTAKGKYTLGGAIASADTITFTGLLGKGKKEIVGFKYFGIELDTNASPTGTIIVGTESDDNGLLTSKVAGNANAQLIYLGDGALVDTITDDENLIITVGGTVATAASSGTLYVEVVVRGV